MIQLALHALLINMVMELAHAHNRFLGLYGQLLVYPYPQSIAPKKNLGARELLIYSFSLYANYVSLSTLLLPNTSYNSNQAIKCLPVMLHCSCTTPQKRNEKMRIYFLGAFLWSGVK